MTQVFHVFPEIEGSKKHSANKQKKNKAIPGMGSSTKTTIPAETVLAIRRAHEIDRVPTNKLSELFPEIKKAYIYSITNYLIRRNLRVK